ncbi:MAG: hypothetical protein AAF589_03515 [Planctomycetota bacterium]
MSFLINVFFVATTHAAAALGPGRLGFSPLLAQAEEEADRAYSVEVMLIMLCVILGLMITLRPSARTADIKKVSDEEAE